MVPGLLQLFTQFKGQVCRATFNIFMMKGSQCLNNVYSSCKCLQAIVTKIIVTKIIVSGHELFKYCMQAGGTFYFNMRPLNYKLQVSAKGNHFL